MWRAYGSLLMGHRNSSKILEDLLCLVRFFFIILLGFTGRLTCAMRSCPHTTKRREHKPELRNPAGVATQAGLETSTLAQTSQ